MMQGRGGQMLGRGRMVGRGGRAISTPRSNQILLASLQDHLKLHIFSMLDNKGRINAFRAIGWSTKRYVQRRDNLRKQMENKQKMKKEMGERKQWRDGVFKNVLAAGLTDEEKKEDGLPTQEMAEVSLSKDAKTEEKELLPHLGQRVDAMTLLCRLNTRRLYGRLKYYKELERKRAAEEEARRAEAAAKGCPLPEPSIIEMYDRDLKEKMMRERIYPKNMTVMQMAQKEWNELIQMANYR